MVPRWLGNASEQGGTLLHEQRWQEDLGNHKLGGQNFVRGGSRCWFGSRRGQRTGWPGRQWWKRRRARAGIGPRRAWRRFGRRRNAQQFERRVPAVFLRRPH